MTKRKAPTFVALEPEDPEDLGDERRKNPCPGCGSNDHHSLFACPNVPESRKHTWRVRGGQAQVTSPTNTRSPDLRTREGYRKLLQGLAKDVAKERNSLARSKELRAIARQYHKYFGDEWASDEADVLAAAAAIVKRQQAAETEGTLTLPEMKGMSQREKARIRRHRRQVLARGKEADDGEEG